MTLKLALGTHKYPKRKKRLHDTVKESIQMVYTAAVWEWFSLEIGGNVKTLKSQYIPTRRTGLTLPTEAPSNCWQKHKWTGNLCTCTPWPSNSTLHPDSTQMCTQADMRTQRTIQISTFPQVRSHGQQNQRRDMTCGRTAVSHTQSDIWVQWKKSNTQQI